MIAKLIRFFWLITNRQRIPKLPRGMLASEYELIEHDEGRVLARLGARDPAGIKVAMRRAKAQTLNELMLTLQHQQAERQLKRRLAMLFARLFGDTSYPTHQPEIKQITRRLDETEKMARLRLRDVMRTLREVEKE